MTLPKRIRDMHDLYGRLDDRTCAQCVFLLRHKYSSRTYLKCALQNNSRGPATDWRARWPACGKFFQPKRETTNA